MSGASTPGQASDIADSGRSRRDFAFVRTNITGRGRQWRAWRRGDGVHGS